MIKRDLGWLAMRDLDPSEIVPNIALSDSERVGLFENLSLSVVRMLNKTCDGQCRIQGIGSGWVIEIGGHCYVVTNDHVTAQADEIAVCFSTGQTLDGTLVIADPVVDAALVALPKDANFPVFDIPYDARTEQPVEPPQGLTVYAVGHPLAIGNHNGHPCFTAGIISDLLEDGELDSPGGHKCRYTQTDAAINPGNSGGPLVNQGGIVVGMNSAGIMGAESMGFAIKLGPVVKMIESAKLGMRRLSFGGVSFFDTPYGIAMRTADKRSRVFPFGIQPREKGDAVNLQTATVVAVGHEPVVDTIDLCRVLMTKQKATFTLRLGSFVDGVSSASNSTRVIDLRRNV